METRRTVCNRDCPDACSILADVEDGRVVRLRGDKTHPVTQGFLCFRTNQFVKRQYSPERLTQPLMRKEGVLTPVSWLEALDFTAQKLLQIRAESGPAAIFHYRSGGSLGLLMHLCDYFFEQFGPVTMKRGDICSGAGDAAQMEDFGHEDSSDPESLKHAKNILIWGKNVYVSSPHTIPVLNEAKARGAKLVLIDPIAHKTARLCEAHYTVKPGGDFALAMAVARCLFENGWDDPSARNYCDFWAEFRALAYLKGVDAWCHDAGSEPSVALDIAQRLYEKPCAILVGWGMARRRNGGAIVRAMDALSAISGNLGLRGGGSSFYFARRSAFDIDFIKGLDVAPRSICEPLFAQEIMAAQAPPIRAVWITAGNPVVMLPDSIATKAALESREFVVVVDPFMTDTAACATVVFPTCTLLEDDDVMGAYGHSYLGASKPVIPPPEGVLSDLQIMQAMADRTGLGDTMAGDANSWKQRIIASRLGPHGISVTDLETRAVRNPDAPDVLFADRKFATASGRVKLITEAATALPDLAASLEKEWPMSLLAVSTDKAQCSQWAEDPGDLAWVKVHPLRSAGCADGSSAYLVSRIGRMKVRVIFDHQQRTDVALMAKGGHLSRGQCANALIAAATTDIGEGGALYDEPVRLEPITSESASESRHC